MPDRDDRVAGRHHVLRGGGAVASFEVQADGNLSPLGVVTGGVPVVDGPLVWP